MRVLFCGGGTAGHISPSLAVAETLLSEDRNNAVAFVGRREGGENLPIEKAGYPLYTLDVAPIGRRLTAENIKKAGRLLSSFSEAKRILRDFSPDVLLATGGYVSYPVVRCAVRAGIPALIHESNAVPGTAAKLLAGDCERILLGFEHARGAFRKKDRLVLVGNPVREDFFRISRENSRHRLKIPRGATVILSFGGSLGAEFFNSRMPELMKENERRSGGIYHIHATGRQYYEEVAKEYPMLKEGKRSFIIPYIDDMPTYLSAADIVICRAGSSTISELGAVGVASILIPSPNVAGNHQYINAEAVYKKGGCVLLTEDAAATARLSKEIYALIGDKAKRESLARSIRTVADRRSAEKIVSEIRSVVGAHSASK